ncbi:hypothetical protein GUITHDRAFT_151202 [Guillardia theta CCMP2712]|uniref:Uncharacterized protein n=1 Tax=Guillardia theta (strain CCMP2712) TaxID=905079 RepID=L1JQ84_GUITC|nr:hypothetical protein GUITHDRAFT_151202 [Guillardia theta CCMP2712]EKX50627.1 hypothetical protein GUITHDRAFT_151202 [Guillardia theta CCMP2712]|eukprot:XP_005837607.1 hypothetical protein GUITHDRAFT_151202 [Guillardia theta CCMP2712]
MHTAHSSPSSTSVLGTVPGNLRCWGSEIGWGSVGGCRGGRLTGRLIALRGGPRKSLHSLLMLSKSNWLRMNCSEIALLDGLGASRLTSSKFLCRKRLEDEDLRR